MKAANKLGMGMRIFMNILQIDGKIARPSGKTIKYATSNCANISA